MAGAESSEGFQKKTQAREIPSIARWWRSNGGHRSTHVALIGAAVSLATALIALAAVDALVHQIVLGDLRNYLARTAMAAAALIDADKFRSFTQPEQETTEEYRKACAPLRVLLETNPDIHFAYSGVTQGERMHFVLDATPLDARDERGVSQHASPMQEDRASPGELEVTRTHRVTVESAPSATAWGMGIRAQAPIFSKNGMVGYVGLTMRADRYAQLVRRTDIAASVGASIAAALALVTGFGILRTQRARELAERANERARRRLQRERDRVHNYAVELDLAEAETRRGTALYLHDEVGQALAGVSMMLETAATAEASSVLRATIEDALAATRTAQSNVRALIQDLSPPELEAASLPEMMSWIALLFESRYTFKVLWRITGNDELPSEKAYLVYRTLRELLNHLEKYSACREVDIKITLADRTAQFQVIDKGPGYDRARWLEKSFEAFGLLRIRKRVQAAGGSFEITALPGQGCWAAVSIPC